MVRIAICDDEITDCDCTYDYVQSYLQKKGIAGSVKKYNHPDSLLADSKDFCPDIYVLDIVMPMLSGIETAREIRWNQKDSQIIFTTSEKSFALEAYDVSPINYIVKPVAQEKLENALEKAIENIKSEDSKAVTVKIKGGFATVRLNEIMYADYCNHVVTFHLLSKENVSTLTLRVGFSEYLDELLPGNMFIRCHESIYVNVSAIDKLTKNEIVLRNKEVIPVSRSRYADVASLYIDYRL